MSSDPKKAYKVYTHREVPFWLKVQLVKAHWKCSKVFRFFQTFLTKDDPWATLSLLRIRNYTPIKHKPKTDRPFAHTYCGVEQFGYVAATYPKAPKVNQKPTLIDLEGLDSDVRDFELGQVLTPEELEKEAATLSPLPNEGLWETPEGDSFKK